MSFTPRMTISGGRFLVRNYAIAASEEWDVGDVIVLNGDGALAEATAAANDVLGAAITATGNTTAGQSDADELRPYLSALLTGKHEPVAIFDANTIFETDDYNSTGTAAYGDIGEIADLELVTADWGINNGTSATSSTPQFRVLDIERTRGTYLVIAAPLELSDVFQFFDAAV